MPGKAKTVYNANFFDEVARGTRESAQTVVPMVYKLLQPASVLDVGCATGTWLDEWGKAGRPRDKLLTGVAVYLNRVLHESGLCDGVETAASTEPKGGARSATQPVTSPADPLVSTACSPPDGVGGAYGLTAGPGRFYTKLEAGMRLALQRAAQSR